MRFNVKSYSRYNELEIDDTTATMNTGFMDENESCSLAQELLQAVDELLLNVSDNKKREVLQSSEFQSLLIDYNYLTEE